MLNLLILFSVTTGPIPPSTQPASDSSRWLEPGKSFYHRSTCVYIRNVQTAQSVTPETITAQDLKPCPVCLKDEYPTIIYPPSSPSSRSLPSRRREIVQPVYDYAQFASHRRPVMIPRLSIPKQQRVVRRRAFVGDDARQKAFRRFRHTPSFWKYRACYMRTTIPRTRDLYRSASPDYVRVRSYVRHDGTCIDSYFRRLLVH